MTRRYVADRRKRNRELAAKDAAARCPICKRNLAEVPTVYQDALEPGRSFCSRACRDEYLGVSR